MGDDLARGERSQVPVNRWAETQNTSPIAFPYVKKKEPWVPSPPTQTPDQWLASQQAKRQNASVANNTRGNAPMMVAQNQPDVGGYWQTDYNVYPGSKPGSIKLIANQDYLGGVKGFKNKVWPFDDKSDDKGAIQRPLRAGFSGRIVRTVKGKQVIIPFKTGESPTLQPGDQIQDFVAKDKGAQNAQKPDTKKLTPQQQRDEAIKKMSYGDKLISAAKMVPDLLKGDAKAAFKALTTDPAFVAQLVGVSAVFAIAQATPAGPFIDAALIAVLGFSGGLSLANYLLKANSAKNEAGLKASANELKNLVEIVGLAALSGALRTASKVLGRIKGGATAEQASRKILFDEMTKAGVKFTPGNIVKVARGQDGKIIFLETGNSKAGLQHIIEKHGAEFAQKGISESQIPDAIMTTVTRGKVVGYVGKSNTRPIYEVTWQGQQRKIAVTTGSNGFIVGAQIFR
jgi:hypothetical protein